MVRTSAAGLNLLFVFGTDEIETKTNTYGTYRTTRSICDPHIVCQAAQVLLGKQNRSSAEL